MSSRKTLLSLDLFYVVKKIQFVDIFFPLFSIMRISIFSDKIELYTAFLFGDENMQNTFRKDAIDR